MTDAHAALAAEIEGWANDCDAHASNPGFSDGDRATYRYRARLLRKTLAALADANARIDAAIQSDPEWEYALEYDAGLMCISDDPADAEEMAQFVPSGYVVRREVRHGEWELLSAPAADARPEPPTEPPLSDIPGEDVSSTPSSGTFPEPPTEAIREALTPTDKQVEAAAKVLWIADQGDPQWAAAVVDDVFSPADDWPDEAIHLGNVARAALAAAFHVIPKVGGE